MTHLYSCHKNLKVWPCHTEKYIKAYTIEVKHFQGSPKFYDTGPDRLRTISVSLVVPLLCTSSFMIEKQRRQGRWFSVKNGIRVYRTNTCNWWNCSGLSSVNTTTPGNTPNYYSKMERYNHCSHYRYRLLLCLRIVFTDISFLPSWGEISHEWIQYIPRQFSLCKKLHYSYIIPPSDRCHLWPIWINWKTIDTVCILHLCLSVLHALLLTQAGHKGASVFVIGIIIGITPLAVAVFAPVIGYFVSNLSMLYSIQYWLHAQ